MKRILLFLVLLLINKAYCQVDKPADHYSLIRGININNNLNTGASGYYVPLYNLKLGELNLKSQLNYESDGFKVQLQPGLAGLNWNVNLIGKITRETIRNLSGSYSLLLLHNAPEGGLRDENNQDCPIPTKSSLKPGFQKKDLLTNFSSAINELNVNTDKFYFDFFGYKGYFIVDNEKNIIVNCETGNLNVLTENLNCQYLKKDITFSEIIMKDDKGNTFYFGGNYDSLDVNYVESSYLWSYLSSGGGLPSSYYTAATRSNYITGWNLKKVILANGRLITVNYIPQSQQILTEFVKEGQKNPKNVVFTHTFPSRSELANNNLFMYLNTNSNFSSGNPTTNGHEYYYTKIAAIDNITIEDIGSLNFTYEQTSNPLEITNLYLKEIKLKNLAGTVIDQYNFELRNLGSNYKRTFLMSVKKNDVERYNFNYQKTDEFPTYNEMLLNKYGYWLQKGDVGLLKKVNTPTGGEIEFEYEPHTTNFNYIGSGSGLQESPNNDAGGARLKKQILKSGSVDQISTFSYIYENGKSTGIETPVEKRFFGSTQKDVGSFSNSYIGYSQITETNGNGKVVYKFSDYITNPDTISFKSYGNSLPSYIRPISKSNERGRLLKKMIYNQNNSLILVTDYKYTNFLKGISDSNLQYPSKNCGTCKISDSNYYVYVGGEYLPTLNQLNAAYSYIPVSPYLLTSEITTEYLPSGKVLNNSKILEYNIGYLYWHPYPIQKSVTNSDGTYTKKYLYPYELIRKGCSGFRVCPDGDATIVGKNFDYYRELQNLNLTLPILEITKNTENKFTLKENLFVLDSDFKFALKKVRYSMFNTILDFDNYSIPVTNTLDDINYDVHDNKANVLQVTTKDDVSTTTIYGYNQTLPIATITGITYAQLMQIFGLPATSTGYLNLDIVSKSNADKDTVSEQLLLNALNTFRNSLPGYQVTTYTYDPLVGVRSITPPSGIRESYIYDSANRLEKIIDVNGKVLKEMKYNYKN